MIFKDLQSSSLKKNQKSQEAFQSTDIRRLVESTVECGEGSR